MSGRAAHVMHGRRCEIAFRTKKGFMGYGSVQYRPLSTSFFNCVFAITANKAARLSLPTSEIGIDAVPTRPPSDLPATSLDGEHAGHAGGGTPGSDIHVFLRGHRRARGRPGRRGGGGRRAGGAGRAGGRGARRTGT